MDTRSKLVFDNLIDAIEKNDEKKVEECLKRDKEKILTLRKSYKGVEFTPIEYAALLRKWNLVNLITDLHKEKIKSSKGTRYGSALIYAVEAGELTTIEKLLNANASIDWHRGTNKNKLLHLAFLSKNKNVIKFLLNYKDGTIIKNNFDIKNDSNQTPMMLAASIAEEDPSFFDIIEEFANLTAKENNKNDIDGFGYALGIAIAAKQKEVVKALLRAGANIKFKNNNGKTAFDLAENNPEILKIFSDYLVNDLTVTEKNEFLEQITTIQGDKSFEQQQKEIIMNLRKNIEETNKENNNALCNAIINDDVKLVESLLKETNINFGDDPIYLAVKNDNATILEFLLNKSADKNLVCVQGEEISKLMFTLNSWKCLELYLNRLTLVSIPGKIDSVYINGFIKVVLEKRYSLVELLNKKITKPKFYNLVDQDGNTGLHHAIQKGEDMVQMVKVLLKWGADTSIKNNQDMNALELACYLNRGNCAIELINNNAVCTADSLLFSIQNKNQEITRRILAKENNLDLYKYDIEKGNIFIYEALKTDNVAILVLLLNKIILNRVAKTKDGKTPLMLAQDFANFGKSNCYDLLKCLRDQKTFLGKMKERIADTQWKKKISGMFFINGYPNHIITIKEKIEKCYTNEIEIHRIFQDIYKILNNLKTSDDADRDSLTITFDQDNKIEMKRLLDQYNRIFQSTNDNQKVFRETMLSQRPFYQTVVNPPLYSVVRSHQPSAPCLTNYVTNYTTSPLNFTYVNTCQTESSAIFLLQTDKGNFLLETHQPYTDNFSNLINQTIGFTLPLNYPSFHNLPLISLPSEAYGSTPFDTIIYTKTNNTSLPLRTLSRTSQIYSQIPPDMTLFSRNTNVTSNLTTNNVLQDDRIPQFIFP